MLHFDACPCQKKQCKSTNVLRRISSATSLNRSSPLPPHKYSQQHIFPIMGMWKCKSNWAVWKITCKKGLLSYSIVPRMNNGPVQKTGVKSWLATINNLKGSLKWVVKRCLISLMSTMRRPCSKFSWSICTFLTRKAHWKVPFSSHHSPRWFTDIGYDDTLASPQG